jgi:hypothetical protein
MRQDEFNLNLKRLSQTPSLVPTITTWCVLESKDYEISDNGALDDVPVIYNRISNADNTFNRSTRRKITKK